MTPKRVEVTCSSGLKSLPTTPYPQFLLHPASLQGSLMPKFLTGVLPGRQASLRNHNKALSYAKKLTGPASLLEGVDVSKCVSCS